MASIGFLIGGALVNALALNALAVITCSVAYPKNQSIGSEKGTIKQLKISNKLK